MKHNNSGLVVHKKYEFYKEDSIILIQGYLADEKLAVRDIGEDLKHSYFLWTTWPELLCFILSKQCISIMANK